MPKPAQPLKNTWEDADFLQVVAEIEAIDTEIDAEKQASKKRIADLKDKAKRRKKIAKAELRIDLDILNASLADRKIDRDVAAKKEKLAAKIPEDKVELWADAIGQYSWLPPDAAEAPEGETASQAAARRRIASIAETTEREQVEGEQALKDLTGGDQVH